jgi:hypothetical protein
VVSDPPFFINNDTVLSLLILVIENLTICTYYLQPSVWFLSQVSEFEFLVSGPLSGGGGL